MNLDFRLWEFIRAGGLMAFLLLTAAVGLGLCIRTRSSDPFAARSWVFNLHQSVTLAALAATLLHVLAILANSFVPFAIKDVLVPFASSWRPLATASGILAMYCSILLVGSFYVRRQIGYRAWRLIHYGSFIAWTSALAHGLLAGHDTSAGWVIWLYGFSCEAVGLLLLYRLLLVLAARRTTARPLQPSE